MKVKDPSKLSSEEISKALEMINTRLPDDVNLGFLCFTGSRAFGWGSKRMDIDMRGFFDNPDWFSNCHLGKDGYDITIRNMGDIKDPQLRWGSWNLFVDTSKPVWIHPDFDYQGFRDRCTYENIKEAYPYNIDLQLKRLETQWCSRSALHSYKEVMYPLHFIYYDFMEINVMEINKKPEFQLKGLKQCRDDYFYRHTNKNVNVDIDKDLVWKELNELFEQIGKEIDKLDSERED